MFEYINFKQHSTSKWHLDFDEEDLYSEMQRMYMCIIENMALGLGQ